MFSRTSTGFPLPKDLGEQLICFGTAISHEISLESLQKVSASWLMRYCMELTEDLKIIYAIILLLDK